MRGTSVVFKFGLNDSNEKRSSSRERIKSKRTQSSFNQTLDLSTLKNRESERYPNNSTIIFTGEAIDMPRPKTIQKKIENNDKRSASVSKGFWNSLLKNLG